MSTSRTHPFARFAIGLLALAVPAASAAAQDRDAVERLRRDQDEILRKAERLQKLMQRLKTRYEREGKAEQVQLLDDGIAHLERAGVLRDVASIREDIETTAFTEALRKQREVVEDLERLLNILLARKSIENLDEEIRDLEQRAATASELERRQRELIEQRRQTMRSELSEQEQQLADRLGQLRDEERREADRNAQLAGTRRPFLESALRRVEQLLAGQEQLEQGLADEASGRTPDAQRTSFDLGDLGQKVRDFQRDLRDQQKQQQLAQAGKQLREAAGGDDAQALEQARDELDRVLDDPPMAPESTAREYRANDGKWRELRERSAAAPDTRSDAGREALRDVGEQAEQVGGSRDAEAGQQNAALGDRLAEGAKELADRMQQAAAEAPAPDATAGERAADAMRTAAEKLDEAQQAVDAGDTAKAQQKVNEALGALDQARQRHRSENPDAERNADQMAAEARATAQELANAPTQEQAERTADRELREAADALRDVADQVQQARGEGKRTDAAQAAQQSRESLEAAREALRQALDESAENNRAELQAAAERQQQLAEQVAQASQQLQQAAQRGDITQKQQQAAQAQLDKAQQAMQQASQQLQQGQQASAAQQQERAADAMQQAMDALEQNREMTEQQRQQLQDQAQRQQELTDDIIRLAEELEKRDNKDAERAVQEAAEASQQAQRAMERGDNEEAEQKQEEARDKLEEAMQELEQEKDRYMDLRQEELLFRMLDELTTFLEKQRPITAQTKEFAASQDAGRLSRPARRKVNGLGEEEQALAGKVEFLVTALTDEGNLVYRAVLEANLEDLREIARRLAGRQPDVGPFVVLLQEDVERRTEQLLEALEREKKRREQERQQQQQEQQQQQGENKFSQQRERLVSLIAELEMLRNLEQDTARAAGDLKTLVEVRGDETITDAEVAMIQRLAHRHGEITRLFEQIKAGVEQAMQQGGDDDGN